MRLPRFHLAEPPAHDPLALTDGTASHIARVLRLRPGAAIELFDGHGHAWLAELTEVTPRRVLAERTQRLPDEAPPQLHAHLLLGLSKGERMDFAIQKAVELGVTRITPTQGERSVVRLDAGRAARRLRHWHGVIVSACAQSGRSRLPRLDEITPIEAALPLATASDLRLLLDPDASRRLGELRDRPTDLAFLVGPEGGLSASDISLAETHGFVAIRLGPRVLRTETAPLALLAAAQLLWGDF